MGTIALAGGAEFGGEMALLDRRTIAAAGGTNAAVSIIPAAAAPDNNHIRAGAAGAKWFQKLGIAKAKALPLIDRSSADDPEVISALRRSDLIYLLGGFPEHLATALSGSRAWEAILAAFEDGAVISGTSAGAMVLCGHYHDPGRNRLLPGLNLIPNGCILPHHDTFGKSWAGRLRHLIPQATLIGIDERTGLISSGAGETWRVYGGGSVCIYRNDQIQKFSAEDTIHLDLTVSLGSKQ